VRFGHVLHHELGLAVGDRVATWMWNRPEYVETTLACGAFGFPVVAANPEWADAELGFVLEHAHARVLICEPDLAARARSLAAAIEGLDHVIVAGGAAADEAPDLLAVISELDGVRTYVELADRSVRFGHVLHHELGLAVGDRVEADQVLATVEAMKMELTVRSPFAGTVGVVAVRPGQRVALDAPLVTVEPDPDPSQSRGSVTGR
jgi:acyl-CoA synthetase (AMP-forming)/AMP-acid ligase II